MTLFSNPLFLGFEDLERLADRLSKNGGDGYPPYNIEEFDDRRLRITLAVAGFTTEDLSVTIEERLLVVRGRQSDDSNRIFLHRGIAARQFRRTFLLAEGVRVTGAWLDAGLLHIELERPRQDSSTETIPIRRGRPSDPAPALHAVGGNQNKT